MDKKDVITTEANTPLWIKEAPSGSGNTAVTALAFSPDGKFFATGYEDNSIHIWETATGQHLYQIEASHHETHQGTITSLHFTPQCRLVSAAKDNTLRVWELHEKGAKLHIEPIANRAGTVSQLGVSEDGRWMLFDKGKELHVKSVTDGHIKGFLPNPMGTSFESLALFSPDDRASLILTAGAPEGRLQLWKTPLDGVRPFEVRQFVPKERSPATCAAFAPGAGGDKSSLAATGCKDGYVYLWEVPGRAQVEAQPLRNLVLDLVAKDIESGTQIRVAVTVPNPVSIQYPKGKLSPGGSVNIVVE
jgi:WD40 repeat protein